MGLPPFARLSTQQIREVLEHATVRQVDEGTTFFREGEVAERFFMLLDGIVRVIRITEDGEQVIALHIPSGQLFGIAQAFSYETYPATAEAACASLVLSWPASLWEKFAADYHGFLTETYRSVGERMGEINERLVDLATKHVEQRIASTLLRLVNQTGKKTDDGIEIGFPITRQDISEMTGSTLHTVSRLLSAWEKAGIVNSKRKRIVVCRPHELVEISESSLR